MRWQAGEQGLVLVSVLWGLAILSLLAASLVGVATEHARAVRTDWHRVMAEARTEAGLALALLRLQDSRLERRPLVDGTPFVVAFDGVPVTVAIQDELGRLDLNSAIPGLLSDLLHASGLDDGTARRLTQRLLAVDAEEGGVDRPFHRVDELSRLPDVTPALFARLQPALTVHSQQPLARLQTAPDILLRSISGTDAAIARAILADRAAAHSAETDAAFEWRAFSITATVATPSGLFRREQVVRLTGNPAQPLLVLDWR